MNIKEFFENLVEFYEKSLSSFETHFETYTFIFYDISKFERVYIIEDSFVIYVGIKQMYEISNDNIKYAFENNYGRFSTLTGHIFIVEELTYNDIFKINATQLKKDIFGKHSPYAPYIYKFFSADLDKPIRNLNILEEEHYNLGKSEYLKTNFYKINTLFPQLDLKRRIDEWKGKPYTFIIYEVNYNGKKGYAVNNTTSPYTTKYVLKSIREIEKATRNIFMSFKDIDVEKKELEESFYTKQEIENTTLYHFPYSLHRDFSHETICCNDAMFREILLSKLRDYYFENNINIKKTSELYPKFIEDGFLRYWIFTDYQKSDYFPEKHIDIIMNKQKYINMCSETIEYHKAENKWKSEEMVYEYTKKLFKKNEVIHQHRPYFLHTKNGQMSYDVFVCGENIAIEYQGKQHFEPVEYFGGKEHFEEQKKRDQLKQNLSRENGILLIYVNYWEDISVELIRNKVIEEFKTQGITKNKYYLKP